VLDTSDLVAFVATEDLARARDFYHRILGLTLVEDSPYACVFDANGTMLRVTPVEKRVAAPYTVLGWRVADISATAARLNERGVAFTQYPGMDQDDAGVWVSPSGAKVAWFVDTDGNTLSLTQFA